MYENQIGKNMKTLTMVLVIACAAMALAAPEEEQYGQRIWFRQDGTFEEGNYLDYFQRSFAGEIMRNQEGRPGYVCGLHFADSRPYPVVPGKTYRLSMKAFNRGMKPGAKPQKTVEKMRFPSSLAFYRGGEDYSNAWKTVISYNHRTKDADCPKGMVFDHVLPAAWTDVAVTFTVPEGATMFTWSYSYQRYTNIGQMLVADVKLKEVK